MVLVLEDMELWREGDPNDELFTTVIEFFFMNILCKFYELSQVRFT